MITLIATGLIPLILCIISGVLLNRYRFIPHETWLSIDKLNYYFLFPALLFSSLSGADIGLDAFEHSLFAALAIVSLLVAIVYLCRFLFKINEKKFRRICSEPDPLQHLHRAGLERGGIPRAGAGAVFADYRVFDSAD